MLRKSLKSAENEYMKMRKCAEEQNERITELEVDLCNSKKELRKAHKKILKYKQLKEHADVLQRKQAEVQKENILIQTAKMKEMFLKEYEDLIIEKNNEIKRLNEKVHSVLDEKNEVESKSQGKHLITQANQL